MAADQWDAYERGVARQVLLALFHAEILDVEESFEQLCLRLACHVEADPLLDKLLSWRRDYSLSRNLSASQRVLRRFLTALGRMIKAGVAIYTNSPEESFSMLKRCPLAKQINFYFSTWTKHEKSTALLERDKYFNQELAEKPTKRWVPRGRVGVRRVCA